MVETRAGLFPVSQSHKNMKTVTTIRLQFSLFSPTPADFRPVVFDCLNCFHPVRLYTFPSNQLSYFCYLIVTLGPMKGVERSPKIIIYNPRLTRRCKIHGVPILRLMRLCHDVIITYLIIHKPFVVCTDLHHNIILYTLLLPLFDSLNTSYRYMKSYFIL